MRILTRYFLRSHLGPFFFSLTVLTSLLFVNTVARRFEELAGKGLPTSVIFEVFVFSLPHILALTLPMAVLVAVLYAFSQLTAENEITALKANGVSLRRLLVPLVVAGTLLAGFMVWFNDSVLP
ncbi:MAG TPA: LptF/LptG family permease, partial [Longimicrobiales bacterium]|nr:LptF/LptG family permease [Longimicrobiales bacterium]